MVKDPFVHPYIPNSVPKVLDEMIKEIGIASLDELFSEIPEELRFKGSLNIPDPFLSEMELTRHVDELLSKQTLRTCNM